MRHTYELSFSSQSVTDLRKLDPFIRKKLLTKIEAWANSIDPMQSALKMVGYREYYRVRFGDYRVIFALDAKGVIIVLVVLHIGHRKDVYE